MIAKRTGFFLGILLFLFFILSPTFGTFTRAASDFLHHHPIPFDAPSLARSMQSVVATLLLMVCWWLTEAVPLPATALVPAIALPLLHVSGIHGSAVFELTPKNVLLNYANPVIFLFFGGFLLAAAMQKWKLDRRMTLWMLTRGNIARSARTILLAMMAMSAFLSMWISNTATAALMLPLGVGILRLLDAHPGSSRFATAMMLGIGWAASIGGVGTIIGTPPNGIALGILNTTFADDPSYQRITFLDWMSFGVPYVLCFLPVAWLLLLKLYSPEVSGIAGGKRHLMNELNDLGRLTAGEQGTLAVFGVAVILWVSNPFWGAVLPAHVATLIGWIDEFWIGLALGVSLFFIPVSLRDWKFLLDWHDVKLVDWGTLLLFGGGIALSDAMFKTGVASWLATSFVSLFGTPSLLVLLFAVVLLVDFLTEITSNTAVTSMIVPIVLSIGLASGHNPVALAVAAALAASMAFMLPVATPPNALVYSTGYIPLREMIRAGLLLDIIGWFLTVSIVLLVADWIFGVVRF